MKRNEPRDGLSVNELRKDTLSADRILVLVSTNECCRFIHTPPYWFQVALRVHRGGGAAAVAGAVEGGCRPLPVQKRQTEVHTHVLLVLSKRFVHAYILYLVVGTAAPNFRN